MNTELKEKMRKYKEELEKKLQEYKEERKELISKFNDGDLSRKENKRNKKLAELIKEIENRLALYDEIELYESIEADLDKLANGGLSKEDKAALISSLVTRFKEFNNGSLDALKQISDLSDEDLKDLDGTKDKLQQEISELEVELKVAQKRNYKTSDIEEEIEEKKATLEQIDEYQKSCFNEAELSAELKKLSLVKTKKSDKEAILDKYKGIVTEAKNSTIEDIVIMMEENPIIEEEQEEEKDKKSLKERTKEKLAAMGAALKRNGKKIAAIAGVAVLTVAIIAVAKSCSKDIEKNNNNRPDDLDNQTTIEQTYENADKEIIDALTKKGYNEYFAVLMAENFDEKTIEALLATPYNPYVENYAAVKEFNLDYIMDYEDARTIYNLTADKAVDYVNRSVKIQETGFYADATINEIVAVVKSVDDKQTFMLENNAENQSITAALTEIYNNYAFNNVSLESDIAKLDALKYFAKDGSELDLFLEEYAEIAKSVLSAKGDAELSEETKQNMYEYLDVFANTYAGNRNDVDNINENAVLEDTYDWAIAYNSFINPLISTFITEQNVENYACLQINMLSNYEQWAQVNGCYLEDGQSLTLGGE